MVTISTRVDELIKEQAEKIADSIGISLSAAISIFLNRFVADEGFPFDVKAPEKKNIFGMKSQEISRLVIRGIEDPKNNPKIQSSMYIDPESGEIKNLSE